MGSVKSMLSTLSTNVFGGGSTNAVNYGGGVKRPSQEDPLGINANSKRPTGVLDDDPFRFSTFAYPQDIVNDMESGHYMLFYVNVYDKTRYEYDGWKKNASGGYDSVTFGNQIVSRAVSGPAGQVVSGDEEYTETGGSQRMSFDKTNKWKGKKSIISDDMQKLMKEKRKPLTGVSTQFNNTRRITDSVAMYLPANVKDDYGVSYTAHETGLLGFLAATGGGMIGSWKEKDYEGFLKQGLEGLSGVMYDRIRDLSVGILEGITGSEGGVELANRIFSRAQNPHMEVLFNSPKMRTFTYSFTMAPKDEQEQLQCKNIIKLFRFHMAPELRKQDRRFFGLPAEFDIHYMYQAPGGQAGENNFYNKIATCVLSDCNVDYTPGGVKSHADGSPVVMKMDLTFQETEMITSDHVEAGF